MVIKFLVGLNQAGKTKLFISKKKGLLNEQGSCPCSFFSDNTCHWGPPKRPSPKKPIEALKIIDFSEEI